MLGEKAGAQVYLGFNSQWVVHNRFKSVISEGPVNLPQPGYKSDTSQIEQSMCSSESILPDMYRYWEAGKPACHWRTVRLVLFAHKLSSSAVSFAGPGTPVFVVL